jgi:ADP-ribose pyrophosphatase YjhB (NUDIX family)
MTDSFAHCGSCGTAFAGNQPIHTRTCQNCGRTSYKNPLPVAVVLVPVQLENDGLGLLCIRRSIPPKQGQLALPGGFIAYGESWQAGAVREVQEETGLQLQAETIRLARVHSAPDSTILIFGIAPIQPASILETLTTSSETSEITVLETFAELAFPLHTTVAEEFFEGVFFS